MGGTPSKQSSHRHSHTRHRHREDSDRHHSSRPRSTQPHNSQPFNSDYASIQQSASNSTQHAGCSNCGQTLSHLSQPQRIQHWNDCSNTRSQLQPSTSGLRSPAAAWMWGDSIPKTLSEWKLDPGQPGDDWWDPLSGPTESIPHQFTPGAMSVLIDCLIQSSHLRGESATVHARLSKDTMHINQDSAWGTYWTCLSQSMLMLLNTLARDPAYASLCDEDEHGSKPSVRRVLGWMEEAWKAGYQNPNLLPEHLIDRGVDNFSHWDSWAALTYLGVDVRTDFFSPEAAFAPGDNSLDGRVVNWVKSYFDEGSSRPCDSTGTVLQTDRNPLLFVHGTHAGLLIGYEETGRGTELLVLNPLAEMPKAVKKAGRQHVRAARRGSHRRPPTTFTDEETQEILSRFRLSTHRINPEEQVAIQWVPDGPLLDVTQRWHRREQAFRGTGR